MSTFSKITKVSADPILGLNESFVNDSFSKKVNLGIGVYTNDNGKIPVMEAIKIARQSLIDKSQDSTYIHHYLPIDGDSRFQSVLQKLLFGKDINSTNIEKIVTVQALGGTGALKIGADFLFRHNNSKTIAISNPSWENHRTLFETAGFNVVNYPYYNSKTSALDFNLMLDTISNYLPNTIVILHACCHNPSGMDLNQDQWSALLEVFEKKHLIPFFDIAYQGFGSGIEEDAYAIRLFLQAGIDMLVAQSLSKSFSLYGERVGALTIVTQNKNEAIAVRSQLKRTIRTNYSNPPRFGSSLVTYVLSQPNLAQIWRKELDEMRSRIINSRHQLIKRLQEKKFARDMSFITQQKGMFSFSGLSIDEVMTLRQHYHIYILDSGRICLPALNNNNFDYVIDALMSLDKNGRDN